MYMSVIIIEKSCILTIVIWTVTILDFGSVSDDVLHAVAIMDP